MDKRLSSLKKVGITGAAGNIGTTLQKGLCDDYDLYLYDIKDITQPAGKKCVKADFTRKEEVDGRNAEYAYYLARSLAEDRGYAGRKPRLNSAKRFSDCALKLQPNHQQAKQLYRAVAAELKKAELNN